MRGYGYADTDTRIRIRGYEYANTFTRIRIRGYGHAGYGFAVTDMLCGYGYADMLLVHNIILYPVRPQRRPGPAWRPPGPEVLGSLGAATRTSGDSDVHHRGEILVFQNGTQNQWKDETIKTADTTIYDVNFHASANTYYEVMLCIAAIGWLLFSSSTKLLQGALQQAFAGGPIHAIMHF